MNLTDALSLKNHKANVNGVDVTFRRPSLADLAATLEMASKNPDKLSAWLVHNHLLDDKGDLYFNEIDKVFKCDAHMVEALAKEVDKLYTEGSSLPAQQ